MRTLISPTSWLLVPFVLSLGAAVPLPDASQSNVIQDHYIFLMKSDLSTDRWKAHQDWSSSLAGTKKWIYDSGQFRGYCGNFSSEAVQQITASDDVSNYPENLCNKFLSVSCSRSSMSNRTFELKRQISSPKQTPPGV